MRKHQRRVEQKRRNKIRNYYPNHEISLDCVPKNIVYDIVKNRFRVKSGVVRRNLDGYVPVSVKSETAKDYGINTGNYFFRIDSERKSHSWCDEFLHTLPTSQRQKLDEFFYSQILKSIDSNTNLRKEYKKNPESVARQILSY